MTSLKRRLSLHLSISTFLYLLFASFDIYFTLNGIDGEIALEGNPVMRYMMISFGVVEGLIIEKIIVFSIALIIALFAFNGIEKRSNWVFYLALTSVTRRWMKRKKRYWVAFVPLYFVAISQGLAALSWVYIMGMENGF
jgi:hypothetical protein